MAISMTGFGRGEVKSDNYQFLDVFIYSENEVKKDHYLDFRNAQAATADEDTGEPTVGAGLSFCSGSSGYSTLLWRM